MQLSRDASPLAGQCVLGLRLGLEPAALGSGGQIVRADQRRTQRNADSPRSEDEEDEETVPGEVSMDDCSDDERDERRRQRGQAHNRA